MFPTCESLLVVMRVTFGWSIQLENELKRSRVIRDPAH